MKTSFKLLILTLFALGVGCIDNQELEPPDMQISYSDTQNIKFSWRQPAVLNVKIRSDEDIERFTLTSRPTYWQKDSVFPPYTHYVNFDLDFSLSRGFKVEDSTVILTFKAYSNDLCTEQFRRLKYVINYPAIDSFDIEMNPNPDSGKCLLDISSKRAYTYTQYRNCDFDLVLVKEDRTLWRSFGLALVSPNAEDYLKAYFKYRYPNLEYSNDGTLKETKTAVILDSYKSWNDLSPKLVDADDNMLFYYLGGGGEENLGFGLSGLTFQTMYKVVLHNKKKAMIKVLDIKDYASTYPTITLRIYYQTNEFVK